MYKKFRLFYAPADDGGLGTSEPLDQSQTDNKQDEQQEQQKQENIKTYTQEDITKLQQQFETDKQLAIEEALKKAKMSADEKAKYEQETKLKEIEQREKDITLRELKADTAKILSEKNIPLNMLDFLVSEDLEKTKTNIDKFVSEYNKAVQVQVEQRLKGKAPIISNIHSNQSIAEQFRNALGE